LALASFEAAFHNIKRDALFVCPRICDKLIVDVFPQLAVPFQVDLHGNLLPLVVGNELNTFHRFSSLTASNDDRTGGLPLRSVTLWRHPVSCRYATATRGAMTLP
jgi:hypothetical protein